MTYFSCGEKEDYSESVFGVDISQKVTGEEGCERHHPSALGWKGLGLEKKREPGGNGDKVFMNYRMQLQNTLGRTKKQTEGDLKSMALGSTLTVFGG